MPKARNRFVRLVVNALGLALFGASLLALASAGALQAVKAAGETGVVAQVHHRTLLRPLAAGVWLAAYDITAVPHARDGRMAYGRLYALVPSPAFNVHDQRVWFLPGFDRKVAWFEEAAGRRLQRWGLAGSLLGLLVSVFLWKVD